MWNHQQRVPHGYQAIVTAIKRATSTTTTSRPRRNSLLPAAKKSIIRHVRSLRYERVSERRAITHAHKHDDDCSWAIFLGEFASSFRDMPSLATLRVVRRGECECVRQQFATTATTNTNLFYLLLSFCLRLTAMFTFSSTPLSPCLPIPIYTDCTLTFTPMYVCSCPTLFSLCLFANPFQRFCFSFIYQYVDWHTSADDTSSIIRAEIFLMRYCPVRNLTNTFPHNRAPTLPCRAPTCSLQTSELPKTIQYCCSRAVYEGSPNSMRDIIKVNTGKFRHLLTRFTLTPRAT